MNRSYMIFLQLVEYTSPYVLSVLPYGFTIKLFLKGCASISSPRTAPLCCYSSHTRSLRNNLASFDQSFFSPYSSSEHSSPGALCVTIMSRINCSLALHRSGSSSRGPCLAQSSSPRTTCPLADRHSKQSYRAAAEINERCWPYVIANHVRTDKGDSTFSPYKPS